MIRPPFRPPHAHQPGTDPDQPLGDADGCGRAGCCRGRAKTAANPNPPNLDSVAPSPAAGVRGDQAAIAPPRTLEEAAPRRPRPQG